MASKTGNFPEKSCLHCKYFTRIERDYGYCDLVMMLPPKKLPIELRRSRISFSTSSGDDKGVNVWVGITFLCKYFEIKEESNEDEDNNEPDNFDIVF